jgi:hypothetical protein
MIVRLMDKALKLESRFSLPPNSLGYCGKETAAYKFKDCIINGNCKGVKSEVKNFIVLNPYLEFLSKITGKNKFDYDVIEGYWIGNNILKKAKSKDYLLLLKYFLKQGVPEFFVDELKEKVPEKFIPSHLFQVLHVGVGKASGAVPFNIKTINNCMIRWGKIQSVSQNKVKIKLNSLKSNSKNKYKLTTLIETIHYDNKITGELKITDTVAIHWGMVIKKLTKTEEKKIDKWTNEVIKLEF